MKKNITYILLLVSALIIPALGANAQVVTADNVKIEQITVDKEGNNVKIDMNINLDDLYLKKNQMIILTPVLKAADNSDTRKFQPVVVMGSRRNRTLERQMDFEGFRFETLPQVMQRRYNKKQQSIPLTLNTTYSEWLRGGQLMFFENKLGCSMEPISDIEYKVYDPVLPLLIEPVYAVNYVTPPVEEVKQRSESHTAHLNFEVGKSTLLRDFQNNASILAEVDKIISEIRNDDNLTITQFQVIGYASPEGNEASNMKLSQDRARAFVSYVTSRYNLPQSSIKIDWRGEDWEGLRRVVEDSFLSNKNEILYAIDEPDVNRRKTKLKQLNGGETYRMLLRDYYPQLRRNDYTIAFVARPFSVNEAKEQIKTKPQYLSLNEMFLVANTYPMGSDSFKEVFDIAVRLYPQSPVAQQNTAALEIENGAYDSAINRLKNIDMPEAYNNIGVAYAKKGDYQRALEAFDKAIAGGVENAKSNKEQLANWLRDK